MLEILNFNMFSDQTSIRSGYVFETLFSSGLQVPWGRGHNLRTSDFPVGIRPALLHDWPNLIEFLNHLNVALLLMTGEIICMHL